MIGRVFRSKLEELKKINLQNTIYRAIIFYILYFINLQFTQYILHTLQKTPLAKQFINMSL